MDNKGTALVVTLVYIMIVAIICVVVLAFSSQHYMLITQRADRLQGFYRCEGGLYVASEIDRGLPGTGRQVLTTDGTTIYRVDVSYATDTDGNFNLNSSCAEY